MGRMPWVLGVVGEIMCVWTLTMLLMYLLGVLLCFSGPQVAPSGIPSMISWVGKRSVALPSLMKEQLDDEPVVRTRYPEDTAVSWGYRILRTPLASWGYRGILRMPLVSCG